MYICALRSVLLPLLLTAFLQPAAGQRLAISDNGRYITYEDGRPFFYLGDTAWELFHRLSLEEAERYLENRAARLLK